MLTSLGLAPAHRPLARSDKALPGEAIDFGIRTAYRVAHRMLRAYWSVRRPDTHGALVAVWNAGEVLLVKNSYRREYTFPGGYIRKGESPEAAGARELEEECGVQVEVSRIRLAYDGVELYEQRNDRVTILEVELDVRPTVVVDNREVVWAGFKSPREVLSMPVVPHIRTYLKDRQAD